MGGLWGIGRGCAVPIGGVVGSSHRPKLARAPATVISTSFGSFTYIASSFALVCLSFSLALVRTQCESPRGLFVICDTFLFFRGPEFSSDNSS